MSPPWPWSNLKSRGGAWRCAVALLVALSPAWRTGAAAEYFTVSWDSDDGLPHNAIYRITQTPDGYLWLATAAGLARFDGLQFRRVEAGLLMDRTTESIRELGRAADGDLIVAPELGGLARIRSGDVLPHPLTEQLGNQRVASAYLARDGSEWFSLFGGTLCRWKAGRFTNLGKFHRSGSGRVTMGEDAQGVLWLAVGDFFGRWQGGTFQRVEISLRPSFHLAVSQRGVWVAGEDGLCLVKGSHAPERMTWAAGMGLVYTMLEHSDGTLWLGTVDAGIFRLAGKEFVRGPQTHTDISCFLEDRESNLWVGTRGGGLHRLRERYVQLFDSRAGLPQDVSLSLCQTADGTIWFANRSGGLVRWDGTRLRAMNAEPGRRLPPATVVTPAPDGGLYVGTESGLYHLPNPETGEALKVASLGERAIRALYTSRSGEVWVSARSHAFGRCQGVEHEPLAIAAGRTISVSAINEDAQGRLVLGTAEGELFRRESTGFKTLGLGATQSLSAVLALAPHANGALWFGTAGDGLFCWQEDSVRRFDRRNGLPDNFVSQLLWQDEALLWVGSRSGISRLGLEEMESASARGTRLLPLLLGRSDGLGSGSCIGSLQPVSWRAADGGLWFATRKGVVRVEPGRARGGSSEPARLLVHLEECRIDGATRPVTGEVTGLPLARKYDFTYTALLFSAPDRLQFRHRLDGLDADWVEAGNRRQAVYPQLPPGNYRFSAQARVPGGEWTAGDATVALIVPPAWWQRIGNQLAALAALAALLVLGVRAVLERRFQRQLTVIRQKQLLENERARIARDLHDELGAGLTLLGHAGHHGSTAQSPEELRQGLVEVSRQARTLAVQMDAIVWTVNPKNDSLPQVAGYLAQFGQEFFRSLPTSLRVDRSEPIPEVPVTPEFRHHVLMLVKEAFNNVAKHAEATEVWLRIAFQTDALHLEIADNGRGFDLPAAAVTEGDGLRNLRTRAQELNGKLEILSGAGKGTIIRLVVPLPPSSK